jgi:hypothetical protein
MHYQPTTAELAELPAMTDKERTYYFLTRSVECEEIWGHADAEGWLMREDDEKTILPVWPYQSLAQACIKDAELHAQATSLERFIEILSETEETIYLEVLPTLEQRGALISATELLSMFESLIDCGTYFLEG